MIRTARLVLQKYLAADFRKLHNHHHNHDTAAAQMETMILESGEMFVGVTGGAEPTTQRNTTAYLVQILEAQLLESRRLKNKTAKFNVLKVKWTDADRSSDIVETGANENFHLFGMATRLSGIGFCLDFKS